MKGFNFLCSDSCAYLFRPLVFGGTRRGNSAGARLRGASGGLGAAQGVALSLTGRRPDKGLSQVAVKPREAATETPGGKMYMSSLAGENPAGRGAESVASSCQQLVERQKEVLRQQYAQVERMRLQLMELQNLVDALQLQASGISEDPRVDQVPRTDSDGGKRAFEVQDMQLVDSGRDEVFCDCSLDPRDYQ